MIPRLVLYAIRCLSRHVRSSPVTWVMFTCCLLLYTSFAIQVDKDVAVAKEHFGLLAPYDAMSPLVLHKGYTRDFLDGKVRCTRQFQALPLPFPCDTNMFLMVDGRVPCTRQFQTWSVPCGTKYFLVRYHARDDFKPYPVRSWMVKGAACPGAHWAWHTYTKWSSLLYFI